MSKYNPKNIMEAMTYQLEDDIKLLRSLAIIEDKKSFVKCVEILKKHIKCCELLEKEAEK